MTKVDGISDCERLLRYITSSGWLNRSDAQNPRIKPEAFMAHPETATSVYRIDGWDDETVKARGKALADQLEASHKARLISRGEEYPPEKRSIKLHGGGVILCGEIVECGFSVVQDEPPDRHAIIDGWPRPPGTRKEIEAIQLGLALKLVSKAKLWSM